MYLKYIKNIFCFKISIERKEEKEGSEWREGRERERESVCVREKERERELKEKAREKIKQKKKIQTSDVVLLTR